LKFNQNCLQEKTLTVSTLSSHYGADDCECKSEIIQVADILKAVSTKNLQVAAATSPAMQQMAESWYICGNTDNPCFSTHEMQTDCGEASQQGTRQVQWFYRDFFDILQPIICVFIYL